MVEVLEVIKELQAAFGPADVHPQQTADGIPTVWVQPRLVLPILSHLKHTAPRPYGTLYDLTAIDERQRLHRPGQPAADFTLVYHLLSYERNQDLRLKVALTGETPAMPSITSLWPCANWYEREVFDMFGITFTDHPDLRRILMPPWWEGHPLRKEHPARATEMGVYYQPETKASQFEQMMAFDPEHFGEESREADFDYLYLNMGPHHPGTHGVLRLVLKLRGQEIVDVFPHIGFHHRGAEKMGERQSWHTYIPYTDRIDYLAGVINNFPYVMAVEGLAGIEVPDRARVIRIMMCELFRIISHLVFLGTFAQDLGMLSPVFYMFNDREHAFDVVEAITGARMHPGWFRIGGVAQDLPEGYEPMLRTFLRRMDKRLTQYRRMVIANRLFRARTVGIGALTIEEAIDWGATGPVLRACGKQWDWRKSRPYGGYEQFEFDIPTGERGDAHDRAVVHLEEMRQSLRIIEQCLAQMPSGTYKSAHATATPPLKEHHTISDIETLIDHFVHVSWGPVVPAGEAAVGVEGAKGNNTYYLVSDGDAMSYRTRIRTPSFAHIQMVPMLARGLMIPDLVSILGSLDFVLADVDR
ncbi:MAG: NADH-quinone oxidoreductase subunit C/D [Armatimonadota bacterium]